MFLTLTFQIFFKTYPIIRFIFLFSIEIDRHYASEDPTRVIIDIDIRRRLDDISWIGWDNSKSTSNVNLAPSNLPLLCSQCNMTSFETWPLFFSKHCLGYCKRRGVLVTGMYHRINTRLNVLLMPNLPLTLIIVFLINRYSHFFFIISHQTLLWLQIFLNKKMFFLSIYWCTNK